MQAAGPRHGRSTAMGLGMKNHIFNIHDVVLLMTIAECFLLAIFQAVLPAKKRASSLLLTFFLLSIAVGSSCVLALWNGGVHTWPVLDQTLLPYFLATSLLIKGPALYFYVCSITQSDFQILPKHALHLIPVLVSAVWLGIFQISSADLLQFRQPGGTEVINAPANTLWYLVKTVPMLYVVAAVLCVRAYVRQLENQYSYFSPTEPGWLNVLTLGFSISWGLTLLVHIIAEFANPAISDAFGIADNYTAFILLNGLFTYSVVYAHQLLVTKPEPEPEVTKEKIDEKIADSAIEKVQRGMEVQKLYLKHNLNIEEFSKRIDLPVKDVSAVINKHYGTNFFEFMNKYRVEEAKRLLLDDSCAEMTVLDILLQAGFNSKSAFHRFFNRMVGLSPTEFRKQHSQKEDKAAA
jgi:AraC-like DNA-binding protein